MEFLTYFSFHFAVNTNSLLEVKKTSLYCFTIWASLGVGKIVIKKVICDKGF